MYDTQGGYRSVQAAIEGIRRVVKVAKTEDLQMDAANARRLRLPAGRSATLLFPEMSDEERQLLDTRVALRGDLQSTQGIEAFSEAAWYQGLETTESSGCQDRTRRCF